MPLDLGLLVGQMGMLSVLEFFKGLAIVMSKHDLELKVLGITQECCWHTDFKAM